MKSKLISALALASLLQISQMSAAEEPAAPAAEVPAAASPSAPSESSSGEFKRFYWTAQGSASSGSTTAAAGAATPSLTVWDLGFIGAYRITSTWFAGLSTDYIFINQTNDPGSSGTNYSGTRWNMLSPIVGAIFGNHTVSLDYELMGNWTLSKSAANSGTATYKNPTGFRLRYFYQLPWFNGKWKAGAQYESLSFNTLGNSSSGDTTLTTTQSFSRVGLAVGYVF